jgi:crotonobetainyl-CoA:carnitine CoA-transferase CaiB-like acyl-CoA transferase
MEGARQNGQWEVVQTAAELAVDVQVTANGYVQRVDHGARSLPTTSAPIHFDGITPELGTAPELGAHTEAILLELGLGWEQLGELKAAGVIT